MCGMEWPLGGKVEWEIKCNSVFFRNAFICLAFMGDM